MLKHNQKLALHSFNDFKTISNRFPLNYVNNVNSNFNITNLSNTLDYYILYPKGRRGYLWFTYYKKEMLCLLIFINSKKFDDISNEFYKYEINYDNTLCYNNVLLIGTYFYKYNNNNNKSAQHYYVIDSVLNYNYYNAIIRANNNNCFNSKLNLCKKVVQAITNSTFNINLGIILDNYDSIFKIIYKLNYDIYCVACYNNNKYLGNFILNIQLSKTINKNETNYGYNFKVTASITPDIYNLYILDNNKEIFYEYALIDSYKTSVFMNDLFRKIKENKNLDLLEESDDEEEFENIDLEKYVDLGKTYIIECFYNRKFKKWVPKNLAKNNYIIDKNKINLIKNKNKIFL
uniref:Uncharacterized protein n=1 Tax=viral metagenome TaxID=1070528 RepID=A0A6C0H4H3_9ZZZZ